jgi:hypothetical protein
MINVIALTNRLRPVAFKALGNHQARLNFFNSSNAAGYFNDFEIRVICRNENNKL